MKRLFQHLPAAGMVAPFVLVAACSQVSSVADTVTADAPQVASALKTICNDLVPAAEATANALAKGGAAATIQKAETGYVTPAWAGGGSAAQAVDSGWLANVVASMVTTAANAPPATPSPGGGN